MSCKSDSYKTKQSFVGTQLIKRESTEADDLSPMTEKNEIDLRIKKKKETQQQKTPTL